MTIPIRIAAMNQEHNDRSAGSQLAPQEECRRSQRVTLRVPVRLHVTLQGSEKIFEAFTVNVNDHGALILIEQSLALNDRFTLENKHTRGCVGCRVARKPQEASSGFQVAIEFDQPMPGFWHIAFPPTDWKPAEDE